MITVYGRVQLLMTALLLCSLSLAGATYRSNSIGMQLAQFDQQASRDTGYILLVEQPSPYIVERMLYHEGLMIEKTIVTTSPAPDKQKTIVHIKYDSTGIEIVHTRQEFDGLKPINLSRTDEYGSSLTLYIYEKGRLLAQREIQDGIQERLLVYYRNPLDGSLVGVRVSDPSGSTSIRYFSIVEGMEIFAEGDEADFSISRAFSDGVAVRETWVAGDVVQSASVDYDVSGNLIVERTTPDGLVRSTYNKLGLILHEVYLMGALNGMEISYSYNPQGGLVTSRKTIPRPSQRIIEHRYVDGMLDSSKEWEKGVLVKTVVFLPTGGTLVTIYDKGKPYADVTYAPDGKKVLSLTYREGL